MTDQRQNSGPPGPPPPKRKPKPATKVHQPKPNAVDEHAWEPEPKESSTKTWIAVFVLCAAMTAGVYYARPYISGESEQLAANDEPEQKSKKKKRKKRKRGKKRRKSKTKGQSSADYFLAGGDESDEDEELWEDEDLVVEDRFRLGEVFEDRPDAPQYEDEVEARPVEKFVPPPEMYKPGSGYRPSSKWAARGAVTSDVVEISMSSAGESAPLTPSQIKQVLNERRLMSCYEDIAKKVPEMKGRVHLKVQIEGAGSVSRVTVTRSKLNSKMVEDCIVKRVRRMKFPRSKGDRRTRFETHFDFD